MTTFIAVCRKATSAQGLRKWHAGCQAGGALLQAVQLDALISFSRQNTPRVGLDPGRFQHRAYLDLLSCGDQPYFQMCSFRIKELLLEEQTSIRQKG